MIRKLYTKIFGESDTTEYITSADPDLKESIHEMYENKQESLYRKLKQSLLKEQISENNQEKFTNFLDSKRPNGTDIDSWTYDDLVELVDEFNAKQNLKTGYTSDILKKSVKKDGWLSFETYYYIETKLEEPDNETQTWKVKRTKQQFFWLREKLILSFPAKYFAPQQKKQDNLLNHFKIFLNRINSRSSSMDFAPIRDFLKFETPEKFDKKYDGCPILKPSDSFELDCVCNIGWKSPQINSKTWDLIVWLWSMKELYFLLMIGV